MLIGYVSDERFLALSDVSVELENDEASIATRYRASGAVHADVAPGEWRITLSAPGYGPKTVEAKVSESRPLQLRLLSDRLLGYIWPKWTQAGQEGEWRVHSPEAYKLDLWRYGAQKECVQPLGWYDDHGPRSTTQLTPDGDYTRKGVQWNRVGFGMVWHQQRLTAPQRSGLYYLHASTDSEACFSFPWIVAPAQPQAPIAVLAHNLSWNAYNNFGGRSNYVNQDRLPRRPIIYARHELKRYTQPDRWPYKETAAPLSFDRPEPLNHVPHDAQPADPIEGRLASAVAPGEWRLLAWLEREGFSYDLYADTQLHDGTLDLDRYRVLILNNHPEYCTPQIYARIKEWVSRSGRLMYLGGCAMYAEAELPGDDTMLCRIEGRHDLFRETPVGLLGVYYTHSGFNTGAPYQVLDASHWAFAGTRLKQGDLFGLQSQHMRCPGGASGHELDKIQPDSPTGLRHLAKGTNAGGEGADMIVHHPSKNGAVFSPGSLCWPLSLLVDDHVSQITMNVLHRFLQ